MLRFWNYLQSLHGNIILQTNALCITQFAKVGHCALVLYGEKFKMFTFQSCFNKLAIT